MQCNHQMLSPFILQPERVNQSRQRRRLLPPARVIKEESWERLTPILQHADKRSARKMPGKLIFSDKSKPDPIKGGTDHDLHVIDDQRPVDRDGQGFLALLELPAVNVAAMPVTKVNAFVAEQSRGAFGFGCVLK